MSEYTTREILEMIEAGGGPGALDLSGSDLSGIDLSKKAIQQALGQLLGDDPEAEPCWLSSLGGITLKDANLEEARLGNANLEGSVLDGANLQRSYLVGANLQEASLWSTDLEGSNLSSANLEHAYLGIANLQNANMKEANLKGAKGSAYLVGAVLTRASLREAHMSHAVLWGADLRGADLRSATLTRADFTKADLTGAKVTWRSFVNVFKVSGATMPDGTKIGMENALEQFLDWRMAHIPVTQQPPSTGQTREELENGSEDKPGETGHLPEGLAQEPARTTELRDAWDYFKTAVEHAALGGVFILIFKLIQPWFAGVFHDVGSDRLVGLLFGTPIIVIGALGLGYTLYAARDIAVAFWHLAKGINAMIEDALFPDK